MMQYMKQNLLNVESTVEKSETENFNYISDDIHVIGKALCNGFVNFNNKFVLHTSGKIPGNLVICIEGPSKAEISFMDKNIGIYILCYRVTIPGEYMCSISFNKVNIPHSPFKIIVTNNANNRMTNGISLKNQTNSKSIKSNGRNLIFHIFCPEILNLNCFVTDPLGGTSFQPIKKMSINSNKDGLINFYAIQSGIYTIDFYNFLGDKIGPSWKLNLENSHGYLKSNILACYSDRKTKGLLTINEIYQNICAYGDGLHQATIDHKNYFFIFVGNYSKSVICKEPSLDVSIDGPSKVKISCVEDINGYIFCYIPNVTGIYFIGIKYSNKCHIPGSPFKIVVNQLSEPNCNLNIDEVEN